MESITRMLASHPRPSTALADERTIADAITALVACTQACTSCADACLAEDDVASMRTCIRLNLDCADVCAATASLLSRRTATDADVVREQLEACAVVCRACGAECERHADHMAHCRVCADACLACERACNDLLVAARA